MRAKKGFNLRDICGEQIIVAEGKENIDFSNIISMNKSSAYLWEAITDKEFTPETLVALLVGHYEVEESAAMKDVEELLSQWREAEIIED